METIKTKKCTKCLRELPLTAYWKDKRNKDGLNCYCKECMKTFTSIRKIEKPDKNRPLKTSPQK